VNFITHNQQRINIGGTSLQGYVSTRYRDLVAKLGEPMQGDGYKVDAEWNLLFEDGTTAAIYNWKNGPAYLGDMASITAIDEWNIGGSSPRVVELVKEALAA